MNNIDLIKFKQITPVEIDNLIEMEFGTFFKSKYSKKQYTWADIKENRKEIFCGIYIFLYKNVVWKIGKHQKDVLKRCREHIRDDSGVKQGYGMNQIDNIPDCQIIIYSLKENCGNHWLICLESFLEIKARELGVLMVRAARVG